MSMTRRSLLRSLAAGMAALAIPGAIRPAEAATVEPLPAGFGLLVDDTMLLRSVEGPLPEMAGRVVPVGATAYIGDDGPELIQYHDAITDMPHPTASEFVIAEDADGELRASIDGLSDSLRVLRYSIDLNEPWSGDPFPCIATSRYRGPFVVTQQFFSGGELISEYARPIQAE